MKRRPNHLRRSYHVDTRQAAIEQFVALGFSASIALGIIRGYKDRAGGFQIVCGQRRIHVEQWRVRRRALKFRRAYPRPSGQLRARQIQSIESPKLQRRRGPSYSEQRTTDQMVRRAQLRRREEAKAPAYDAGVSGPPAIERRLPHRHATAQRYLEAREEAIRQEAHRAQLDVSWHAAFIQALRDCGGRASCASRRTGVAQATAYEHYSRSYLGSQAHPDAEPYSELRPYGDFAEQWADAQGDAISRFAIWLYARIEPTDDDQTDDELLAAIAHQYAPIIAQRSGLPDAARYALAEYAATQIEAAIRDYLARRPEET